MKADSEFLDTQQCLQLMAGMTVGRVVYTLDAMPAVLPVRFRIDPDGSVVVDEGSASDLVQAVDGAVIAFETGEVNGADGSGWSVTVVGRASVASAPVAGTAHVADADQVLIRLHPEVVTGRRLASPAAVPLP
jgi:nitroimidazol reductase NimA-like FMN-containing flavoprotein (pyridoxamine 5'-phosphate oxidase superfamily)